MASASSGAKDPPDVQATAAGTARGIAPFPMPAYYHQPGYPLPYSAATRGLPYRYGPPPPPAAKASSTSKTASSKQQPDKTSTASVGDTSKRGGKAGSLPAQAAATMPPPAMMPWPYYPASAAPGHQQPPPPFWFASGGDRFPVWQTGGPTGGFSMRPPPPGQAYFGPPVLMFPTSTARKTPVKKNIQKLSNDDMRKHLKGIYEYKDSLYAYAKTNDVLAQRATLSRAMLASGLKAMKEKALPWDDAALEALEKFLGKRTLPKASVPRRKRPYARRPPAVAAAPGIPKEDRPPVPKIVKRVSNDDMKKHCMALYSSSKSLLTYVRENGLEGQRATIARAFRGSGLKAMKEQGVADAEAQDALEKYLGKRKEFTPIDEKRGLTVVEIRKHVLAIYATKKSLRNYCQDKNLLSKRATLARAFTASGLRAMKEQDPLPDPAAVREALEKYLKTRRKKKKKLTKKMIFLSDSMLRDHLQSYYATPFGSSMRAYCHAHGIEKHRTSLRNAWDKSGLKALKESAMPPGPIVNQTLDNFFAARRQRTQAPQQQAQAPQQVQVPQQQAQVPQQQGQAGVEAVAI